MIKFKWIVVYGISMWFCGMLVGYGIGGLQP